MVISACMQTLVHVLTGMVWFHPLQCHTEHSPSLEINFTILCDNPAFDIRSGPKCVTHRTPRVLRVGSEVGHTILPSHKTWRSAHKLYVDHAVLIARRFNRIIRTIVRQLHRNAIGVERVSIIVEAVVLERIGGPECWLLVVWVPNFAAKLSGDA